MVEGSPVKHVEGDGDREGEGEPRAGGDKIQKNKYRQMDTDTGPLRNRARGLLLDLWVTLSDVGW